MLKKSVGIIMIIILLSLPIIVLATSTSELYSQQNEIKDNITSAEGRQDEIEGQISSTKAELNKLKNMKLNK